MKSKGLGKPKGEKKMTLMERAMMKQNESNDEWSQDSYQNRS